MQTIFHLLALALLLGDAAAPPRLPDGNKMRR